MRWVKRRKQSFSSGTSARKRSFSTTGTVLRQACRVFRREFMHTGNIEVLLDVLTIASACNKFLRKRILQTNTIELIPSGECTCNNKYSKKALMWLLHKEQTDGVKIMHCRNGRQYKLPQLPHFSVDGYCPETNKIYEYFGCFSRAHVPAVP